MRLYTNTLGEILYEKGEIFVASKIKTYSYNIPLKVSDKYILSEESDLVEIDTSNDVEFL